MWRRVITLQGGSANVTDLLETPRMGSSNIIGGYLSYFASLGPGLSS